AIELLIFLVACLGAHGIDETAATSDELQSCFHEAGIQAAVKGLMEIPYFPQFFFDPTIVELLLIRSELCGRGVARAEGFVDCFGGEHATFDRRVNAFEALGIQQACGITDDQAAVDKTFRHGIPAAVWDGLRAVANELAAFEN